jgi:hypothetical protein
MAHHEQPKDLEPCLTVIQDQLTFIYARWNVLIELFGSGPANIDVINRTLPHFFVLLQNTYLDDVIIGIGRLLDSEKTGRNKNLSLASLYKILSLSAHVQLAKEVEAAIDRINVLEKPLRDHRNRKIAHNDYRIALQLEQLPPLYISNVNESLMSLALLLNSISIYFRNSETEFAALRGEGAAMIHYLKKAEAQIAHERATLLARKAILND